MVIAFRYCLFVREIAGSGLVSQCETSYWTLNDDPGVGNNGGNFEIGGGGGPIGPPVSPLTQPSTDQQKQYDDCVRQAILQSIKRSLVSIGQMNSGGALMAGGSVSFALGSRFGLCHMVSAASAGYFWNALSATSDAVRLGLIGIPFYGTGALLFSNGLDTARLNPSATSMAVRNCRDRFPNSR